MSEINTNNMERADLEKTATDLGLSFAHNISDDNLRKKINEALGTTNTTTSNPTPPAPENEPESSANAPAEKRFEIIVQTHDQDKQPVQVGVNGKTHVIQRGQKVTVPESVVEVLKNAVQFQYDPNTMERTEVLSYPFQIVREV